LPDLSKIETTPDMPLQDHQADVINLSVDGKLKKIHIVDYFGQKPNRAAEIARELFVGEDGKPNTNVIVFLVDLFPRKGKTDEEVISSIENAYTEALSKLDSLLRSPEDIAIDAMDKDESFEGQVIKNLYQKKDTNFSIADYVQAYIALRYERHYKGISEETLAFLLPNCIDKNDSHNLKKVKLLITKVDLLLILQEKYQELKDEIPNYEEFVRNHFSKVKSVLEEACKKNGISFCDRDVHIVNLTKDVELSCMRDIF
jgi:hypothetical protein